MPEISEPADATNGIAAARTRNSADLKLTLYALQSEKICNDIAVARDGEEALDYIFCRGPYVDRISEEPPRLILLDLRLRKVSGLSVLRELKAHERTKVIPVVVLTSSREEIQSIESYKLGVNSYVVKPADSKKFAQVIGDIGYYWLTINQRPYP